MPANVIIVRVGRHNLHRQVGQRGNDKSNIANAQSSVDERSGSAANDKLGMDLFPVTIFTNCERLFVNCCYREPIVHKGRLP